MAKQRSALRRIARAAVRKVRAAVAPVVDYARRPLTRARIGSYDKLHLGAGGNHFPGWANVDMVGRRNLIWDLTKPLPLKAGALKYVYSEHFVEHVRRETCVKLLANARACMAADGVARISTPDLRQFSEAYLARTTPPLWTERNPTRMFNELMRNWGHTFLYDEEELTGVLHEAGFSRVKRVAHGESEHPVLRNRETRAAQLDLIVEAQP